MPRYRHPRAPADVDGHAPERVHISRSEKATVAPDGTFEAPEGVAEAIADHHGVDVGTMAVPIEDADAPLVPEEGDGSEADAESESEPDTCQEVLTSGDREGEVCGRELPCRFHSDDGED